ncbi:MAG: rod-binding protein [Planctomycetes bacterium]|nr:rod-binding protein [Planctomycetota bacterium]
MTATTPVMPLGPIPPAAPVAVAGAVTGEALALRGGRPALARAARDFESLFLGMLMRSMRQTVKKSELFDGGRGEEVFQDLLDEKLSQRIADGGRVDLGVSRALVKRYGGLVAAEAGPSGGSGDEPRAVG